MKTVLFIGGGGDGFRLNVEDGELSPTFEITTQEHRLKVDDPARSIEIKRELYVLDHLRAEGSNFQVYRHHDLSPAGAFQLLLKNYKGLVNS